MSAGSLRIEQQVDDELISSRYRAGPTLVTGRSLTSTCKCSILSYLSLLNILITIKPSVNKAPVHRRTDSDKPTRWTK
jgi:hypothetical protein